MPSIQDVADQINARLDQINTNTSNTTTNTANIHNDLVQTNNRLTTINNTLTAGFASVTQGIFALLQVQLASLAELDHIRQQEDTIICELANSNNLLCNIMRKLGHQLQLSEASLKSVLRIEGIVERVHCCEAGDYDRDLELIKKLEECCPPERQPEEPCPEQCRIPPYREHQPS